MTNDKPMDTLAGGRRGAAHAVDAATARVRRIAAAAAAVTSNADRAPPSTSRAAQATAVGAQWQAGLIVAAEPHRTAAASVATDDGVISGGPRSRPPWVR